MNPIPTEPQVIGVSLTDGGIELAYMQLADIRQNGLAWQHRVFVPDGSDYDDEIEAVTDALQALLVDVLEDEKTALPVEVPHDEDEDDDDE